MVDYPKGYHPTLLTIPAELRLAIFSFLFSAKAIKFNQGGRLTIDDGTIALNLLLVNKAIKAETQPFLLLPNLVVEETLPLPIDFLPRANVHNIKRIHVNRYAFTTTHPAAWSQFPALQFLEVLSEHVYEHMPRYQAPKSSWLNKLRCGREFSSLPLLHGMFEHSPLTSRSNPARNVQEGIHRRLNEAGVRIRYRFRHRPSETLLASCIVEVRGLPVYDVVMNAVGANLDTEVHGTVLTDRARREDRMLASAESLVHDVGSSD